MQHHITNHDFLSSILNKEMAESHSDFIYQILLVIENNYHDPDFTVTQLSLSLNTNRIYLYRKLREILDINASSLIRVYRLHKARELILTNKYSLSMVAINCGFSNASYFTQCFKSYFGMIPSNYQKSKESKITFKEVFEKKLTEISQH